MSNQTKQLTGIQKVGGLGVLLIIIGLAGALFFYFAFSPAVDSTVNFDLEMERLLGFIGSAVVSLTGVLLVMFAGLAARLDRLDK